MITPVYRIAAIVFGLTLSLSAYGQSKNESVTSERSHYLSLDVTTNDTTATSKQEPQKFLFEFIGGPSLCMFYGRPIEDKVPFLRYTISLGASYQLSKKVDLDAKLLWEAKGLKTQFWGIAYTDYTRAKIMQGHANDYLTLSLGLSYYVDCDRRLFVGAGVGLSYLADANSYVHYYGEDGKLLYSMWSDASPWFKTFDVGLTTLIGYRRSVTKSMKASIQLFGNLGMMHVFNQAAPYVTPARNANLGLLVGIGIPYR